MPVGERFLFDVSFDEADLALAEAEATAKLAVQEAEPAEPEQNIPTFTEDQLNAARYEGYEAGHEAGIQEAGDAIEKTLLDELNFQLKATYVGVGDPVDEIIEAGKNYSAIVLGGSMKSTLQRMITSSIPLDLVRKAPNSVMIIR